MIRLVYECNLISSLSRLSLLSCADFRRLLSFPSSCDSETEPGTVAPSPASPWPGRAGGRGHPTSGQNASEARLFAARTVAGQRCRRHGGPDIPDERSQMAANVVSGECCFVCVWYVLVARIVSSQIHYNAINNNWDTHIRCVTLLLERRKCNGRERELYSFACLMEI